MGFGTDAAYEVGGNLGLAVVEVDTMLRTIGERNPRLLVGGYDVDLVIVAAYGALRREDGRDADGPPLTNGQIVLRIEAMLDVMYEGLV